MITVNVWTAGNPLKNEYGHASIQLESHLPAETLSVYGSVKYISWWPAPKGEDESKFAIGRKHIQDRTFENDCASEFSLGDHRREAKRGDVEAKRDIEKYEKAKRENRPRPTFYRQPDHRIKLPDLVHEGYGLDTRAMFIWWSDFNNSNAPFHLFNYNCSSCASIALIHGGARHFVPELPREGLILKRNPKDVVKYATDVRRALLDLDDGRRWVERQQLQRGQNVHTLWSENEWMQASKVTGFDHRYTSLKRIDQAVREYNREKARMPAAVRILRMDSILMLIGQVVSERPTSKRLDALATLGKQAIQEKQRLLPSYNNSTCDNADVGTREDNLAIVN